MVMSKAKTVKEYLDTLPADRRAVVSKVRAVVRKHLPKGYQEAMNWGGICYVIPLKRYPITYNKQPLVYAGLGAQKNYYVIHLLGAYTDSKTLALLKTGFKKAGKKLNMGKSCIRFRKVDDLPLDVIGKLVASMTPAQYIKLFEAARK
jgi:hypothetical protein